jgi:hypothetical protein
MEIKLPTPFSHNGMSHPVIYAHRLQDI